MLCDFPISLVVVDVKYRSHLVAQPKANMYPSVTLHAVTPLWCVTGIRFSGSYDWQQRKKTMDNPFSKPTVTAIGDDDRCEVDDNNERR